MSPKLVFHAKDVVPFSPPGAEEAFESRLQEDGLCVVDLVELRRA